MVADFLNEEAWLATVSVSFFFDFNAIIRERAKVNGTKIFVYLSNF